MNGKRTLTSVWIAIMVLASLAGLAAAQGLQPQNQTTTQEELATTAAVNSRISYQGVLEIDGRPVTGRAVITFALYSNSGCTGAPVDVITKPDVQVTNGLFSADIDVDHADFNGQGLWLKVLVGITELGCKQILPVPYALSLRPGADIIGAVSGTTTSSVLLVQNTATSGRSYAIRAEDSSTGGRALIGEAKATSGDATGVRGESASTTGYGVYGWAKADSGQNYGVYGKSDSPSGTGGYFVGNTGIYAASNNHGIGIYAYTESRDIRAPTLYLRQGNPTFDFVQGFGDSPDGGLSLKWRVDGQGRGDFSDGIGTGGADLAEQIAVVGEEAAYKPGDVLVISTSADRTVALSSQAYDSAVIGVYSTEPGVLAGAFDIGDPLAGIPVAVIGIAPCKVSAENGPIQRGDLLVTSSTPGHAMKADRLQAGTIIGKAMGRLDQGTGIIPVLVTLQ